MFKNLYTRLAAVLLGLFLLIGVLYILLTLYTTRLYFQEVNQKLNRILAQHLVSEKILMKNGKVDNQALQNIFHMLMVVNPVIEVYLLDSNGDILAFSAPPGKVKRQSVSLGPVKRLLSGSTGLPVLGDDPRDLRQKKVFSVAPISLKGRTEGYLYIILGGEEFETEAQMLRGSYILRLSIGAAAGGLLFALLAALLLFNRMTRRLRLLAAVMETFRQRDFSEPLEVMHGPPVRLGDEIDRIGMVFTHMADRITAQIRELKKADKQRREFTANIAHDLRTPLASLLGYLETLLIKEGQLTPEERRDYLTTSIKRSEQLGKLVNALFELATLDSPDVQVRFEPFSLVELVHDILQKYRLAADTKKVRLELDTAEDLPLVYAEIGLCERVFENLIDNALRHTPEGGFVRIAARRVRSPESEARSFQKERLDPELKTHHSELDADFIEISVVDTGSGIPLEDLPHLFDRFSRRDRSRTGSPAGSGLGLAIAKRILELHGSGIDVKSTVNAGTTFTFALPVYQSQT
jgi:two-component system OmpR family sensor kinase